MTPNSKALRALVERLCEALKPFAKAVEPDDSTISGWRVGIPTSYEDNIRAVSALTAAEAHLASSTDVEGWRVKPLDWVEHPGKHRLWRAQAPHIGWYGVADIVSPSWQFDGLDERFTLDAGSADEAFAAAQADYERRIRSALVPTIAGCGRATTLSSLEHDAPASNGEAAGAVNAEMLAALEHARHKMWEYGFSEDDLAPVREAIAKAEHGRVSVGLNDELLVAAWLCTKRDNGHSILRFTQPKDHKQWTFRPLFLGGRDDHG